MIELRWITRSEPTFAASSPDKSKVLQFRQITGVTDEIYEATMKPKNIYSDWEDVPTEEST